MTFQSKHASRFMFKYSGDTCYIRDKHCLSIQFKVVSYQYFGFCSLQSLQIEISISILQRVEDFDEISLSTRQWLLVA